MPPSGDPLTAEWAERIRSARAHLGLTQTEFGRLLGPMSTSRGQAKYITYKTVSEWERELTLPRREARKRLSVIFAQIEAEKVVEENGAAV